jgi:hypothetical protein
MAETPHHELPSRHAHEERDVNLRLLGLAALGLIVLLGGGLVLVLWVFDALDVTPAGQGLQTAPVVANAPRLPAPPLQTSPSRDMQDMLAAENARLQSYAWVDQRAGMARIPLQRALDLMAERGLPTWPAELAPTTPEPNAAGRGATTEGGR